VPEEHNQRRQRSPLTLRRWRLETLTDKRNDCMKKSEKIEIVGYALAIITIFTLIQSPLLNAIGVVMAVRMLFRLKSIYSKENKNA